jgi:hypothetical protein
VARKDSGEGAHEPLRLFDCLGSVRAYESREHRDELPHLPDRAKGHSAVTPVAESLGQDRVCVVGELDQSVHHRAQTQGLAPEYHSVETGLKVSDGVPADCGLTASVFGRYSSTRPSARKLEADLSRSGDAHTEHLRPILPPLLVTTTRRIGGMPPRAPRAGSVGSLGRPYVGYRSGLSPHSWKLLRGG